MSAPSLRSLAFAFLAILPLALPHSDAQSLASETLILDRFEDGSFFSNPDGSPWVRTARLNVSGLPVEEIGSGSCFLPGGTFIGAGYGFSNQDDTVPLQDAASSFVFEWVIQDAAVTSPATNSPSRDFRVWFGVNSTKVTRSERPILGHTDDGGVGVELFLNSDLNGETEASLLLQSGDETNQANDSTNLVTHFSESLDPAIYGESNGAWSSRRLVIRLDLTNSGGGAYAFQLTATNELGETALDRSGTLNVGIDFDAGAFPFFAAANGGDGKGTVCFEEFSTIRKPVEGMAFITGRAWQDVNHDEVRGFGEAGIPGVPFQVIPANGDPESFRTGSDGYYRVPVKPGSYTLSFDAPSRYDFVAQDAGGDDRHDSDIDPVTGRSIQLTVADDEFQVIEVGLRRTGFLPAVPGGGTLAYEGFDYPADVPLQDLDGGEGVLWDGAWRNGLSSDVLDGNLSDSILPPSIGRRVKVSGFPVRDLTQRFGDDGTEVYVSWLMFLDGFAAADGYVRFYDGGDNTSSHVASIGYDLSPAQSYLAQAGPFGAQADTRHLASFDHTNKTRLFVVRFSFGDEDQDYIDSWIDPAPGTDFSLTSDRVFGTDLGFDRVLFWGFKSSKPIMDEFRIGATARDVLEFTFFPPPLGISGRAWEDLNADGRRNAGELALPGAVVVLLDENGAEVPGQTALSDVRGAYEFPDLPPAIYSVQVSPPGGFLPSPQNAGASEAEDSDFNPQTGRSAPVSLEIGESIVLDAAFYRSASIAGTAWDDANGNGVREGSEGGLAEVPVALLALDGTILDRATTVTDGTYSFSDLDLGDYFVSFTVPALRHLSAANQGADDSVDSDVFPETGRTGTLTLAPGTSAQADAGFYPGGTIAGRLWNDFDADGIEDTNEPGPAGIRLELFTIQGETAASTASTLSSGDGSFVFGGLPAGSFQIGVTLPDGRRASPSGRANDPSVDSDLPTGENRSDPFVITAGSVIEFDVGILPPPPVVNLDPEVLAPVAQLLGSTIEFTPADPESNLLEFSFECLPVGVVEQDGQTEPFFPRFQVQESPDLINWTDFGPPVSEQIGGLGGRKSVQIDLERNPSAYYRIVVSVDDREFTVRVPEERDPSYLPLSGGRPTGGTIEVLAGGSLGPFAYIPQGNGGSTEGGLRFHFPDGATIVTDAGNQFIEYNVIEIGFGSDSIWSLDLQGMPANSFPTGGIRVALPAGQLGLLRVGELNYTELAEVLGIAPEEGIPLRLYRRYPLSLRAGRFTRHGIVGAVFGLGALGLPLPPQSGDYSEGIVPLNASDADGQVSISAFGASEVGEGALMTATRELPFHISLSSGGQISVNGLAILEFANGFKLATRVHLDGGSFCFEIRSNTIDLELLLKLARILPGDPAQCVPGDGGEDEIDEAEACLRNFQRAYQSLIGAAGAVAVIEGQTNTENFSSISSPPDALLESSMVAALAAAIARIPNPGEIPLPEIARFSKSLRAAAPTVRSCLSAVQVAQVTVDLIGALAVMEANGATAEELEPIRADLIAIVTMMAKRLEMIAAQPDTLSSKQCASDAVTTLAELATEFQSFGILNTGLLTAAEALIIRIGNDYARTLGVKEGVTDYEQNEVIKEMDRFTAFDHFAIVQKQVVGAALLGVDPSSFDRLDELTAQLFGLAADQTEAEARAALLAQNPTAFLLAFAEMTDVSEFGTLVELGGTADFLDLAGAITELLPLGSALVDADAQRPPGQRTLTDSRLAIRTLANIASRINDNSIGFWIAPINRVHTELSTTLDESIRSLDGVQNLPGNAPNFGSAIEFEELMELLQAGAAYMRLGRKIDGVENTYEWEQSGLPEIAERLATIQDAARMNQALAFLFKEVELLEKETAQAIANPGLFSVPVVDLERARLDYLAQIAVLLDGMRTLIIDQFLPGLNSLLPPSDKPQEEISDVELPGDLRIINAGGYLCYNSPRDEWSGGLRGTLFFPRWASSLTIADASISSRGNFDLLAHGFVLIPTEDPHATLQITPERPLHVFYHEDDGFGVEGRARLSFDNGVFFETTVSLRDPVYAFELVAGGFQFSFEKELARALGRLDPIEEDEWLNAGQIRCWNQFYSNLTPSFQPRFPGGGPNPDPLTEELVKSRDVGREIIDDLPTQAELFAKLIEAEDFKGDVPVHIQSLSTVNELIRNLDPGLNQEQSLFQVVVDFFAGQAPEATFVQEAAQLEKIVSSYRKLTAGIKIMQRVIDEGGAQAVEEFEFALLKIYLDQSANQLLELTAKLRDPESPSFPLLAHREITQPLSTVATELILAYNELALGNPPAGLDAAFLTQWTEDAAKPYLRTIGFGTITTDEIPGQVIETFGPNQEMIDSFDYLQAERNLNRYLEVMGELALVGSSNPDLVRSQSHLRALLDHMILRTYRRDFELDENAGGPIGQFVPQRALRVRLVGGLARLEALSEAHRLLLDEPLVLPGEFMAVTQGIRDILLDRVRELPPNEIENRIATLRAMDTIDFLRVLNGLEPLPPDRENLSDTLVREIIFEEPLTTRLSTPEIESIAFIKKTLTDKPGLQDNYKTRLISAAQAIDQLLDRAWELTDISQANRLCTELMVIDELMELIGRSQFPPELLPTALIPRLAERLVEISNLRKDPIPLADLAGCLLDAAEPAITTKAEAVIDPEYLNDPNIFEQIKIPRYTPDAVVLDLLRRHSGELLNGNLTISKEFFVRIIEEEADEAASGVDNPNTAKDAELPGGLTVKRVAGALMFNRETGYLKGGFAGRLEFPDPRAFFSIDQATIDSDGSYSLVASTRVPLDPNGDGSLTVSGQLNLAGNLQGLDRVSGTGLLSFRENPNADPLTVNADLSYLPDLPGRPFRVSGGAEGLEDVTLLGNDFALFGGQATVEFSTDNVGAFALSLGASVGLFGKSDPLPSNRPLTPDDFHVIVNVPELALAVSPDGTEFTFSGGEILLSEPFRSEDGTGDAQARPRIVIDTPLCVRHVEATGAVGICTPDGQPYVVALRNVSFPLPGVEGMRVTINNAELRLGDDQSGIHQLDGTVAIPLPGDDASDRGKRRTVEVGITGKRWNFDRFPEGLAITLESDLRLADFDGFTIDLLGSNPPQQTSLGFSTEEVGGEAVTTFNLTGAMRMGLNTEILRDADTDNAFAITAVSSFSWNLRDLPEFAFPVLIAEGRFKLGGDEGLVVTGIDNNPLAQIRVENLENLWNQAPDRAFKILISGSLEIAGLASFGLVETGFVLDGRGQPMFQSGGFEVGAGEMTLEAIEGLPIYVSSLGFRFSNPSLPLVPAEGQLGIFSRENVRLIVSGGINLPSKEAIDNGSPGLSGQVQDLEISFRDNNGSIEPVFNTNGFGIQIENLDLPPLMGLTGGLFVGNLNFPENLYFAGVVGGKINDTSAEVLLALNKDGLIGACFEIDAGPLGIPIDGGLLGGIMLTGVKGGVSFENGFLDPCDFASFITLQDSSGTKMPVNDGQQDVFMPTDPGTPPEPVIPIPWDHCLVANAGGEFPVASVNPLCEPHPSIPGRIVFKGTILTPTQVTALGITPATVPPMVEDASTFAANILRSNLLGLPNDPFLALLDTPPGNPAVDFVNQKVNEALEGFVDLTASFLRSNIDDFLASSGLPPTKANLHAAIEQALGAGVPCLDTTVRLEAKLSHAATPSVLKGNVGVVLSTTGTVVLDGDIEVSGIPFGQGEFIFQLTDQNGDVNPSFGGYAKAAVGPLEFGNMSFGYTCEGCTSNFFDAFGNMLAGGLGADDPAVRTGLVKLMEQVAPRPVPRSFATPVTTHFDDLSEPEKLGYLASVANLFVLQAAGNTAPLEALFGPNPDVLLEAFLESYIQFQTQVQVNANPIFCFEQEVQPKLFGFPLGPPNFASLNYAARVNDPISGENFQQFSATWGFSPSALALSILTGGSGSLLPSQPIDDLAEMSFSYRIPAWTEQRVRQSIEDPLGFTAQSTEEMMKDMVIGFGYAFRPLGLELANGQGRIIMPRLDTHPTRPGVDWQLPNGPGIATRSEVILAALNRGRLKDATWRGQAGDLDNLFLNPGTGDFTPSAGSCSFLVDEIASTLDPAAMDQFGFADSYFPYGGLIGGAEISLPNFITQLPPPEMLGLFAVPLTLEDAETWLVNATFVFDSYLRGTTCSGQLAFYIPAPNPLQLDWDNATTDDLMKSLALADFGAVVDRTLPEGIYPFDQILFEGWLQAQLLGLPLAEATMRFEPAGGEDATGSFLVDARITEGTWLSDLVNANLTVEVKGPAHADNGSSAEGSESRIEAQLALTQSMTANDLVNDGGLFVEDTLDALGQMLPRASVHAAASLQIPPELESFMNVRGDTAIEFFSFSPAFEPGFMPGSDDPYAIARRRGGNGIRGNFNLGYYPETGEPIELNVDNVAFAITPSADPSIFPAFAGKVEVGRSAIPFLPVIQDGEMVLNTSPDNGFPFIAVEANLEPFVFGLEGDVELLRFDSLNGPGGTIGGRLDVIRRDGAPLDTEVNMRISPMAASIPFLGPNVGITVYGEKLPDGTFTDFSFSTSAATPWQATVCISDPTDPNLPPSLALCDPFDPVNSDCLIAVAPTAPICGTIYGRGTSEFSMEVTIPGGIEVTFFPGQETEATVTLELTDQILLYVDHTGRFFVDFGDLEVDLPGIISAGGHITFGFNPEGSVPNVSTTPQSVSFGPVDVLETNTIAVDVSNLGLADANVVFRAQPPSDFTVNSEGFRLTPGMTNTIDVIFHPSQVGARAGDLLVESNDPDTPRLAVPLNGTGTATPKYFQSRDTVAFGDTVVGGTSIGTVTIGNAGSATMQITGISLSDPSFTLDPAPGTFAIAPGESQLFRVSFTPLAKQPFNGTLNVQTATVGSHQVALTGNGSDPRWLLTHDAESLGKSVNLNDIVMFDAARGWVAGDQGTLLETTDGGRSWSPRVVTTFDLNTIAVQDGINNAVLAEYHFEDPPGARTYEDSSPNGRPATTFSAATSPLLAAEHGRFGRGLRFDGSNDYVELGNFRPPNSFSISMWVNPEATNAGRMFISRNGTSGFNDFFIGIFNGTYRAAINNTVMDGGTPQTGWQHIVFTASYNATLDRADAKLYRDGVQIASRLVTNLPNGTLRATAQPWSLGQEWDSRTLTSDHLRGAIDEVYIFDGVLSSTEITALGAGGLRTVVAGDGGSVFNSFTKGANWKQIEDQRVRGWRLDQGGVFEDYEWFGAGFETGTGQLILGGENKPNKRILMIEDLDPGMAFPGDEMFANASFAASAGSGAGEFLTSAFGTQGDLFALGSRGVPYRASSPTSDFGLEGPLDLASLHDAVPTTSGNYVAVGDGGTIMQRLGANPVHREAGLTSNALRGVTFNSSLTEELHAVGDAGAYLVSDNLGTDWVTRVDGLAGNNRGIDVVGSGANYEAWAVGEESQIRYRPENVPAGPFIAFAPGELDFGFRLVGDSRTLPLRIYNRGNEDLIIANIQVEGSPFSIVQGVVPRVAAGDAVTLYVRYKPTASSVSDQGALNIFTNESGRIFRIPLIGRANNEIWEPVPLNLDGEVVDVEMLSDTNGFALVETASGTRLRGTIDGGATWGGAAFLVIPNLPAGQKLRLNAIDFDPEGAGLDIGAICGAVLDTNGNFVRGIVLRSDNGGSLWFDVTPAQSSTFEFADISIHDDVTPLAMVTTTLDPGGTRDGDVWQTEDAGSSWQNEQARLDNYDGAAITVVPNALEGLGFSKVFAAGGNFVHGKLWRNNWLATGPFNNRVAIPSQAFHVTRKVRDMQMIDVPDINSLPDFGWFVGDKGLFWRFDATVPGEFRSADNAEVFGTTDLSSVSFSDRSNGWVVGESKIFTSSDSGDSWDLQFDSGELAQFNDVIARSTTKAWAGGSLGGRAIIWRYTAATAQARGVLAMNDVEILDPVNRNGVVTRTIQLENLGNAPIDLHHLRLDSDDPLSRFRIATSPPPSNIPAGESVNIDVEFEAIPEGPLCEGIDPGVFLRFEQDPTATTFFDDSVNKFEAVVPADVNRQPVITDGCLGRDKALHFDGNDYAEISEMNDFVGDFSVSLWVNPESGARNQNLVGRHTDSGGNRFLLGFFNGGYHVRIHARTFTTSQVPVPGWQHLVVTGDEEGGITTVTIWRNGEVLGSAPLDRVLNPTETVDKPWVLGGDWDSATTINDFFKGCMDEVLIVDRVLTPHEIQCLASHSPLYGEHRATLVVDSSAEGGTRTAELRTEVVEESNLMIFDTVPTDMTITIDGIDYQTPVAFGVGSSATNEKEWCEGSMHKIELPDSVQLMRGAENQVEYAFCGYDCSAKPIMNVSASKEVRKVMAEFAVRRVTDLTPPVAAAPSPIPTLTQSGNGDGLRQEVIDALANTPKGPFFRLTGGNLTIPGLGQDGFAIDGELFLSPTRMYASLMTSPLAVPGGDGPQFLELGASCWLLDFEIGQRFIIKAHPPSLELLGIDLLPDAFFCLEFDTANDSYRFAVGLEDDYRPLPDFLEFKQGAFAVEFSGGAFALDWTGGIRVLKLPDGNFAIDEDFAIHFAAPSFDTGLKGILQTADIPVSDTLLEIGAFRIEWPNGDLRIVNDTALRLELSGVDFVLLDQRVVTNMTGSVGLDGVLEFSGNINEFDLCIDANCFSLETPGGNGEFLLRLRAGLPPSMRLLLPEVILQSTAPGWPAQGISIPGLDFDSSVIFDTGRIPLPLLAYDGIDLSTPDGGKLRNNHLRFIGGLERGFRFDIKAEIPPFLLCSPQQIAFFIDNLAVGGSYSGNFCILPEPVSIEYNPLDPDGCQFSGTFFGIEVRFGSSCNP